MNESFGDPSIYGQADYAVRFDWGIDGARAAGIDVDAIVVVDVLSFSTAVSVAVAKGALVYPFRWRDQSAVAFAAERKAVLAGNRGESSISLSPQSLAGLGTGDRIVLPSPNGATICAEIADRGIQVLAGSIRNAAAVSTILTAHDWSVAVIAAGEHWHGSAGMRPCFEDLVGAGAILSGLDSERCSPEAITAVAAYRAVANDLDSAMGACAGGRELAAWGFAEDVTMAAALNADGSAALLSAAGYFTSM